MIKLGNKIPYFERSWGKRDSADNFTRTPTCPSEGKHLL